MSLYPSPETIRARVFSAMPQNLRKRERTAWADFNKGGQPVDCFLEGPSFDRAGNLYVTDIPNGRILRISPKGTWELVASYDGWPNGLKIHNDGRILITDYKRGIMVLDPDKGAVKPLIETHRSESFKGVNDLHIASNGDIYFTDQGQTGLHDPTGRVYRYSSAGRLECLIGTIPSPNGIVLDLSERAIFVAVTRANAVWRLPIMPDGALSKVGVFIQLSGGLSGPDGLALDIEGGLIVAHAGMGAWRFDRFGRPTHYIEPVGGHFVTNIAFGGPDKRTLYMTESESGTILAATLPVPGRPMAGET